MIRRYPITIAATAGVAGMAVVIPTSSGQVSTLPDTLTLEMRHREAKVAFVDEPPRMRSRRSSESPGDTVIARGRVRSAAGVPGGQVHSEFIVTGGRSPRTTEQATGTLVLGDGQIAIHGAFANTGREKDVIAIVGGTGSYNGASGSAEIVTGRRAVTFTLRFRRSLASAMPPRRFLHARSIAPWLSSGISRPQAQAARSPQGRSLSHHLPPCGSRL